MPRGRMQHNTALPCGKSCSAYATKLIMFTLKNNFLPTIFQFTKTMEWKTRTRHMPHQKLCLTTVDSKYRHGKPLMRPTLCRSNFHAVQHSATCHSMQKPCRSCVALMSTLFSIFAMFCCILPYGIMWMHLYIRQGALVLLRTFRCDKF